MIDHLSYSSITMYASCAASWRYKYLVKAPTYPTPDLAFGSAAHSAIEKYVETKSGMLQLWTEAWEKEMKNEEIFWGHTSPIEYFNEGVRLLTSVNVGRVLSALEPYRDNQGAFIERKIEVNVPGVPIPVIGYIDMLADDMVPVDFKTSRSTWTFDRAKRETQPVFYLAALSQMEMLSVTDDWRFRHIVILKQKTPRIDIIEHSHKPDEIAWLFQFVKNTWDAIQAEAFPENPTSWKCNSQYCDFWKMCRGKYE